MVDKQFLNDIEEMHAINKIVDLAFEGRRRSANWMRNIAVAVAVVVIGIPTLGYTFPAFAQQIAEHVPAIENIPIIGGIFARRDIHEDEWLEDMAPYAIAIGQRQEADGVAITLNEAYFNGRDIYLTYHVESERSLDRNAWWFNYDLGQEIRVLVDSQEIPTGGHTGGHMPFMYWVDDYNFFFILSISIIQGQSPILTETLAQAEVIEVITNFSDFRLNVFLPDVVPLEELCMGVVEYEYNCWEGMERDEIFEIDLIAKGPWNFSHPVERGERVKIAVGEWQEVLEYHVGLGAIWISPTRLTISNSIHRLHNEDDVWTTLVRLDADELSRSCEWLCEWADMTNAKIIVDQWEVVDNLGMTLSQLEYSSHFEAPSAEATYITITPLIYEWYTEVIWNEEAQEWYVHKSEFSRRIEAEPFTINLPQ